MRKVTLAVTHVYITTRSNSQWCINYFRIIKYSLLNTGFCVTVFDFQRPIPQVIDFRKKAVHFRFQSNSIVLMYYLSFLSHHFWIQSQCPHLNRRMGRITKPSMSRTEVILAKPYHSSKKISTAHSYRISGVLQTLFQSGFQDMEMVKILYSICHEYSDSGFSWILGWMTVRDNHNNRQY